MHSEKIVKGFLEPLNIFDKLGERASELADESLGFICGVIRDYRPCNIVEIGVSAGGTTAVILNCLNRLNIESMMWSVDLAYTYHNDTRKNCGYQIEQARPFIGEMCKHQLLLGRNIAQSLPWIVQDIRTNDLRGGIDLLILDTAHYLPGELLDFLVVFPYLSANAVVIVDDLVFCHAGERTDSIATPVLYSSVVADKIRPEHNSVVNMAGFQTGEHTKEYIDGVFRALTLPWHYRLSVDELSDYRKLIVLNYDKCMVDIFDEAVRLNDKTLSRSERMQEDVGKLLTYFSSDRPAFIYGAGTRGKALLAFLRNRDLDAAGFVISDGQGKERFAHMGIPIYYLSELLQIKSDFNLILALADESVQSELLAKDIDFQVVPNYIFPFVKQYVKLLC